MRLSGPVINLSFERLFGQLIAIHDSNAEFIADRPTERSLISSRKSAFGIPTDLILSGCGSGRK